MKISIEASKNLDDIQSVLGRNNKAINSQNHEITLLENSIEKEIVIQHIYSEVHIGILKELSPNFVTLDT